MLWAMSTLGFEEYVEPLRVYLQKYREVRPARPRTLFRSGHADAASRRFPALPCRRLRCELRAAAVCTSTALTACAAQGEKASAAKAGEAKKDAHFHSLGFQQ